ncbi:hypothetical protein BGW39_001612 [Mortierella sp. 14UC]|nr:hypothetical protein BGW39_001612 [Mortierella sp. 14UC]
MVNLKLTLLSILAPLLVANTANASFAACVGIKDVSIFKTVFGFHLWNDDGTQAASYKSDSSNIGSAMQNNGWNVIPRYSTSTNGDGVDEINILHKVHKFPPRFYPVKMCTYTHNDRFRGIYFVCYEHANSNWCKMNEVDMKHWCYNYLEMGTDSVSCIPQNRPNP